MEEVDGAEVASGEEVVLFHGGAESCHQGCNVHDVAVDTYRNLEGPHVYALRNVHRMET